MGAGELDKQEELSASRGRVTLIGMDRLLTPGSARDGDA